MCLGSLSVWLCGLPLVHSKAQLWRVALRRQTISVPHFVGYVQAQHISLALTLSFYHSKVTMSLDDTLYTQALFPERCGYPIYTPCPTFGEVCEVGQIGVFDRGEWNKKSDSQTMKKYEVCKDRNFSLLLSDARWVFILLEA